MTKLDDLATFSRHQLDSKDVDPVYSVLAELESALDPEQALWYTLLYVAYYNLPSAHLAALACAEPRQMPNLSPELLRSPTGIERRGLRGGVTMRKHLRSLAILSLQHGSLGRWLTQGFEDDSAQNWRILQETLQQPDYNGRWAAYKTGEILMKVNRFPVQPTDMGMRFSSGPRWGLSLFFPELQGNDEATIHQLDDQGQMLLSWLDQQYGVRMGIEQLETMLCDFHSLAVGRYYVGHDIDQLQEQIDHATTSEGLQDVFFPLWAARRLALPRAYLGEFNGWLGVDKARKRLYRDTGRIVTR